jgi:hypothetical protein
MLKLFLEHYTLPNKNDKEILLNGKTDSSKNQKKSSIKKTQKSKSIKLVTNIFKIFCRKSILNILKESIHHPKETFVELVHLNETEPDENDEKVYEWRELSR